MIIAYYGNTGAVVPLVGERYHRTRYTDQPQHRRKIPGDPVRYISIDVWQRPTDQDIENIEVALWMLGATADTRRSQTGLRGTCVIGK